MDSINEGVINKLADRASVGERKYGVTMDRQDLTVLDWLQHAQQEAMDLSVYLEKLIRLNGTCVWKYKGFNRYATDCEHTIEPSFDAGTFYTFCPYCGRRIEK